IHELSVDDSTVTYRDGATARRDSVKLQHLSAHDARSSSLVDVDLDARANDQPVRLTGTVGAFDALAGGAPFPIDLHGEVAGLAVTARGDIGGPLQGHGYSLDLGATGPSLAGLGAMLSEDLPAAGPVRFAAVVENADRGIRFRDLSLQIRQSDASGSLIVQPGAPNWQIDAAMKSNHLDLADLRTTAAPAIASDDRHVFAADPYPLEWIGHIDAMVKWTAGQVVAGNAALTSVDTEGTIKTGRLTLASLRFGYLEGEVAAKGSLDASAATPEWQLQASARHMIAGEALKRLLGIDMISGGTADIDLNAAARGRSARDLASTVDGTATANMGGGRIKDGLMRLLLTDPVQAVSLGGNGAAELQCLTTRFDFADGVGRARSFVADTGAAAVTGRGSVNLKGETIDMRFTPSAKQVSLAALAVPVDVRGALGNPSITPDPLSATAKAAGTAAGIATGGLAGAVLGLAGADTLLDEPAGSCARASTATATSRPATPEAQPTAPSAQPATTAQQKTKKRSKRSPTDQILDGAGEVANGIGNSIGDLFGSSTSARHDSTSTQGSKD
ncbi:MAG TPA: AsmA-like C-terminal region-containing protein, partial [Methylomirabilota bacterium]|nr:AsmA-like C-terminal region-containing protein [Methylomirabilota bacterium]